jgi:CRP/FNR family transcriptional regulator, cyclic AMP receptor protein
MDAIATLRGTELFGLLSDDVLAAVTDRSETRGYGANEMIFEQGDEGDALYVLEAGAVRIVNAEGGVLATLGPPATFGELGLMQQRRTATAEAIEPSTVRVIGRDGFLILMREHPSVSDALYRAIGSLLRRVLDRTSDMVFLDLHGRVAKLLLERAQQGDRPGELALTPTEDGMSGELGAATSTVHQILTTFEDRGYLELEGDRIVIREPELLARRAGL